MLRISLALEAALLEYRAAIAASPRHLEVGWMEVQQRKQQRVYEAANEVLRLAADGTSFAVMGDERQTTWDD